MESTPQGKPNEHALWPLYGSSSFAMRLEMVDSITFRTELEISGMYNFSLFVLLLCGHSLFRVAKVNIYDNFVKKLLLSFNFLKTLILIITFHPKIF